MDRSDCLACPRCLGPLEPGDSYTCRRCAASYPTLRGIVDLRTADDLFLSNRDDREYALRLDEDYDRLDFLGLLDRYFDLSPEIPDDLRRRQVGHILTAPERSRRWLDALGPLGPGALLDLGCGTGSFLAATAGSGRPIWGIDIALRWLLVARKRLDEEGRADVRLVCGCAEHLPFRDRAFAGIVAGDVIEHVADQAATLAEAHRVLRPGGRAFFAAPNRFSLAPEPHVQVWGVGFLPRRWMSPYVQLVRKIEFRAIHTLGFGEWKAVLRQSSFESATIAAPGLPASDLAAFGPVKRAIARLYNTSVATRAGQALARRVGPLFHVVGTRGGAGSGPTSRPATRRRSRRPAARA